MSCVVVYFVYRHRYKNSVKKNVIVLSICNYLVCDEIDLHNIIMSLYVITDFFRCLFSGICVCLIMRAGHVVEMSTWTKAIIAASAVIIMVHWYCRTTNVYLHFCIYCYNASDIMEENIISWNRVMSMRCCIFKSHIFIIHIILEKLLPAFGIIYNS